MRIGKKFRVRRSLPRVARDVLRDRLTYLDGSALKDLHDAIRSIEKTGLEGALIEAGCALGGSAIVMASAKSPGRPMNVYDTFGMIPPPSKADGKDVQERYRVIASGTSPGIGSDHYYGYEPDLLTKIIQTFDRYGFAPDTHEISFVQGLFEDTLRPPGRVALAHIDADWYESVTTCLRRIAPQMVVGGRFVIDDYDRWSGCHRAVDEFLSATSGFVAERHSRLHLVRFSA